jgi:transposase
MESPIGWIKLHRKIMDSTNYFLCENRSATTCEAWIDLLMLANYESKKWRGLPCHRGEILYSQKHYAERWKWHISKVRRWLKKLEKEGSITKTNEGTTTRVTINNFALYQDQDIKSTEEGKPTPTKEGRNENEKEEPFYKHGSDFVTAESLKLAKILLQRRIEDNPNFQSSDEDLLQWAKTLGHCISFDYRSFEDIKLTIEYITSNDYWIDKNINPHMFRNGFEHFYGKAFAEHKKKPCTAADNIGYA